MNIFKTIPALAFVLLSVGAANAQQTSPLVATPGGVATGASVGAAAPPRCDANCVRSNASRASEICAPKIEAQAPIDFDWVSRPTSGIFQQADPLSPADAIVRYRGDSVRFMTGQKAWVRVSYECAYDTESQTVVAVNVRASRLDQPVPAGPPINNASVAAAIPARVSPQAAPQQQAAAQPMPAQPPRPKPKVWEPSLVEIQQQTPNPRR